MAEDDPGVLVCLLYDEDFRARLPPSADVIEASCGHRVFIGKASLAFIADKPHIKPLCGPCSGITSADDVRQRTVFIPPGVPEEITEALGPSEGDQLMAYMRDLGMKLKMPDE